jgi:hypothetical protein
MGQSQRYSWMHVLGTHDGCAVIAYPQGLRRNTAALLELRCCCRGMRYGCFRWWRSRVSQACERTASYGGARTGLRRFALGLFGRPPRARAGWLAGWRALAGLLAEDLPLLLQATSSLTTIPPSQKHLHLYSRAVLGDFSFTLSTHPSTAL